MKWKDYIRVVGSGIPLVIEAATLIRMLRGSKRRFVVRILVMLMLYNGCSIGEDIIHLNG
jgi:hypothetical protein